MPDQVIFGFSDTFSDSEVVSCSECGTPGFIRPWLHKFVKEHNIKVVCICCVDPKDFKGQIAIDFAKIESESSRLSHVIIHTNGKPIKDLPFHGELMTCFICRKQKRSNPKEESNWTHFQYKEKEAYLCPVCWSPENLTKVIRYLEEKKR